MEMRVFVIDTRVGRSRIHGVGCFTAWALEAGRTVWVLDPRIDLVLTASDILAMPSAMQIFLARYASKDFGKDRYVYCSDNARFINHSRTPNLVHNAPVSATEIVTSRPIAAGEELTLNYDFVDDPGESDNVLARIAAEFGETDYLDPRVKDRKS
jgi:uncharacterized protein